MNPDPNVDMTPDPTPTAGQVIQPSPQSEQTTAAAQPAMDTLPPPAAPAPINPSAAPVVPPAPTTATQPYTVTNPATPAGAPAPQPIDPSKLFAPDNPTSKPPAGRRGRTALLLTIVALVVIAALAAGAYVMLGKRSSDTGGKKASTTTQSSSTASQSQTSVKALSSLNTATLAGSAPTGYTPLAASSSTTFHDYRLTIASGYNCEFGYGIFTAAQIPGTTSDEIVANSLQSYRTNQASDTTIVSKAGTSLTLKDTKTAGTTYTVPTYITTITYGDGAQIVSHYSVAILGDTTRLVINRTCTTDGKTKIDPADVTKLDTAAANLTVTLP